jgi:ribosomal protein S21
LYSSRRIELTPTQATPTAFRKLSQRLQEEQVLQRVKERRYFVRPGLIKHAITYAGRRKKFNQLVKSTINRIVDHKESQK